MEPTNPAFHLFKSFGCTSCGYAFRAPVSCGNRFCDVCHSPRTRNIRAKLTALVNGVQLQKGERFRLFTFSITNSKDLKDQSRVLLKSFRKLRQRQYWQSKVSGGAFVLEVKGSPGNWHMHIHAVVSSKFMSYRTIQKHWKVCSGGLGCHLKTIPKSAIVHYITKYVTKSELPSYCQNEASESLKGTRLFNPFGSWYAVCNTVKRVKYVCPKCGDVSWYMSNQAVDEVHHKFLSALGEHDLERWALAEADRRCRTNALN